MFSRKFPDSLMVDLISNLPQSIIELILVKIPIKDAIRTSLLSKKWRYKWMTIPNLEFNDSCVNFYSQSGVQNFISHCLSLHEGSIQKFVLQSRFLENTEIDYWLLILSRKGIREISIELYDAFFRVHSCLFTCSKLTHLKLVLCKLSPPPSFKGFLFLKSLYLEYIALTPPDSDGIQRLISSCPLLETLHLSLFDKLELTICAPNLKHLSLDGAYKDLYLENTPHLISVIVTYEANDANGLFENITNCKFDRFFGKIPRLERLVGKEDFTYYISRGIERSNVSVIYDHLKWIELDDICLSDFDHVSILLQLITNSPNLEKLQLTGCYNSTSTASTFLQWSLLEEEYCVGQPVFSRLRTVKLTKMYGLIDEMEFIKFIFKKAPILEVISVVPGSCYDSSKLNVFPLEMSMAMTTYHRASRKAELIFL